MQDKARSLLSVVSAALVVTAVLGVIAFVQYRKAVMSERQSRISEIQAIAAASEGRFDSDRRLDALVDAIRATRKR